MTIQVLVTTMNQTDYSLPSKLNLKCDAIIGNQCNRNSIEKFDYNGYSITYLNFSERGVGLNRNNSLMRASADICVFSDDDMVFCDDYVETIVEAFNANPDADILIFNLIEEPPVRYIIKKTERVWYLNYLRYGTARIAIKLKPVRENGIYFNQCFGGGTEHSHGEDNLFLTECLKKGLRVYAIPKYTAKLTNERESTWNNSFDEKYLADQGSLYRIISRRWWKLLCLQDAIRRRKSYNLSWINAYKAMTSKLS